MKVCLAATPFHITLPPNGLATLKGYLRETLPGVTVKTFDLNLDFIRKLESGRMRLACDECPSPDVTCSSPQTIIRDDAVGAMAAFLQAGNAAGRKGPHQPFRSFLYQDYSRKLKWCYDHQLRAYLEHDTLTEACCVPLTEDAELLLAEKPDLIGISILSSYSLLYALALARQVKQRADVPVVLGGAAMSFVNAEAIFKGCRFVDFIVQGEGEEALRMLIEGLPSGRFDRVPNLLYREGTEVRCNAKQEMKDLNTLPFADFSDYDLDGYLLPDKMVVVSSSRGCYWEKCTFCVHFHTYTPGVRTKSISRFMDELAFYRDRFGVSRFYLADDALSPSRLARISDEIIARKLDIRLSVNLRPDKGITREILQKAHSAGFRWIFWGVESLTQRVIDILDKGTRVEEILRIVRWCRELGIHPYLTMIVGLPFHSGEEYLEELRLLEELSPHPIAHFTRFELYYGSPMYRDPERFSLGSVSRKAWVSLNGEPVYGSECCFSYKKEFKFSHAIRLVRRRGGHLMETLLQYIHYLYIDAGYDLSDMTRDRYGEALHRSVQENAEVYARQEDENAQSHFLAGLGFLPGSRDRALVEFEKAGKAAGQERFRWRLAYYRGICHRVLGRHDQALAALTEALAGFPGHHAILRELGAVHYDRGDYLKASEALEQALPFREDDEELHCLLGDCYHRTARYERALGELTLARELNPQNEGIALRLAECCRELVRRSRDSAAG